jgi:arabinan endo-1,5-alpha-L-arabinosidase
MVFKSGTTVALSGFPRRLATRCRQVSFTTSSAKDEGQWPAIPRSQRRPVTLRGPVLSRIFQLVWPGIVFSCALAAGIAHPSSTELQGDTNAHDPSMIKEGDTYYVFSTGSPNGRINQGNIQIRTSNDRVNWRFVGTVFDEIPAWIVAALGTKPRSLWAPDVSYFRGKFHLYYAGSMFGTNNSVIGLATNGTLDPSSPRYKWTDEGLVIRSNKTDSWNAIDPNLSFDTKGSPWLSFGSFFSGIKMRRIDPNTGKLSASETTQYSLAARPGNSMGGAIEAPSIVHHKGYYYLFVSFDFCCRGVKSDYKIMVGRAKNITGPYTDQAGRPMEQGGGTLVLAGNDRYLGPGGQSVYRDGKVFLLVHHYYDALDKGRAKLQIDELRWTVDGWPAVAEN